MPNREENVEWLIQRLRNESNVSPPKPSNRPTEKELRRLITLRRRRRQVGLVSAVVACIGLSSMLATHNREPTERTSDHREAASSFAGTETNVSSPVSPQSFPFQVYAEGVRVVPILRPVAGTTDHYEWVGCSVESTRRLVPASDLAPQIREQARNVMNAETTSGTFL